MKSYLKFLSRNKLYTAIEVAGLIVSLAFVLLTGHYVWKQRQMTRNVPDYKDVYTVYRTLRGQSVIGQSWGFAYQAREGVPEVEKAAMFWKSIPANEETIELNSERYHVKSFMVGGDFFDIFPAEFESGGPEVLSDVSNVIISRSFANRQPVLGPWNCDAANLLAPRAGGEGTLPHRRGYLHSLLEGLRKSLFRTGRIAGAGAGDAQALCAPAHPDKRAHFGQSAGKNPSRAA